MSGPFVSDCEIAEVKSAFEDCTRCFEAKDFDTWATYWTEDAMLMPPGAGRVVGRDAIVDYMKENYSDVDRVALSNWEILGQGDLAVMSTDVELESRAPSEPMKQVIVACKNDAGDWQWKIIIFNACE